MKNIILPAILLVSSAAVAQTAIPYTMKLQLKDGNTVEYRVNDIDEITFDNSAMLAFVPTEDVAFPYAGATKTYKVNSNIDWNITADNDAAIINKVDNETFTVTLPFAISFENKTTTLTLSADGVEPATMAINQESAVTLESGILNGNTLTAESTDNKARVKSRGNYKFGEFTWTFSNINIDPSAYFSINNWSGNVYMMVQFGDNNYQLASGGEVNVNNNTICFGFDNGWGSRWPEKWQFSEGTYPTNVSEMKSLRIRIEPTTRTGTNQNQTISRKVWINDVLVLDNSVNVGNVWCEGSTQAGFNYLFGIEGGAGSMTIDSFEYKPL